MIKSGERWEEASKKPYPGGSYGKGSAMRIAPIGSLYHDTPANLKNFSYKSSRITHAHPLGMEGADLQDRAVALATSLDPSLELKPGYFLRKLKILQDR